jgi:hypothetical protein
MSNNLSVRGIHEGPEARSGARPHGYGSPVRGHGHRPLGVDAQGLSPGAQVATSLAVILAVMLSGLFFAYIGAWWIVTTYGWIAFPAFGTLARGAAGLDAARQARPSVADRETELLRALERHGELTPARAAVETESLSVAEADEMLRKLAEAGHLEVRVRGGGLLYALWDADEGAPEWRAVGRQVTEKKEVKTYVPPARSHAGPTHSRPPQRR